MRDDRKEREGERGTDCSLFIFLFSLLHGKTIWNWISSSKVHQSSFFGVVVLNYKHLHIPLFLTHIA